MSNINQLAQASIPVFNAQVPEEGPVAMPVLLDFSASTDYDLDLYQIVAKDFISMIQTIFIDSTGCTTNVSVTVAGSNQVITVLPNTQGYYPVICPNPPRFHFHCATGPANVLVILTNVPIAPGQWATA